MPWSGPPSNLKEGKRTRDPKAVNIGIRKEVKDFFLAMVKSRRASKITIINGYNPYIRFSNSQTV